MFGLDDAEQTLKGSALTVEKNEDALCLRLISGNESCYAMPDSQSGCGLWVGMFPTPYGAEGAAGRIRSKKMTRFGPESIGGVGGFEGHLFRVRIRWRSGTHSYVYTLF